METEEEVAEETQTQEETQETSNQDTSESDQKTDEVEQKQPKLWQVVREIQKDLKDLKKPKIPEEKVETKSEKPELSPKDLYALMEAKVPQADVDEVLKASKVLGKSIPETLQDGFVQSRLKELAEQRKTAEATNTTGSKRTTTKVTDESLVEQAKQGKMPDPEALAAAEFNLQKKKA